MGREIVRQESPNKPGNRSRLWRQEDILRTIKNDEGTDALQGISLTWIKMDVHLSSRVFEKMCNLKTLNIKSYLYRFGNPRDFGNVHLPDGLDYLPDELRYLHWHWYPLEELPSCFNPVNLVELDLAHSNIKQLWDGRKCLPKLKQLNLSYCKHLIRIPDLSDIPSAEHIRLEDCISLLEIHSSTQCPKNLELMDCKNLKSLDLTGCISLTKFPQISGRYLNELFLGGCKNLEMLPSIIYNLRYLNRLYLDGCSKLEKLPPLSELPSSLSNLEAKNCKQLIQLLPDESEFDLHVDGRRSLNFNFMNCLKLDQKAVRNVFRESVLKMQLMKTEKRWGFDMTVVAIDTSWDSQYARFLGLRKIMMILMYVFFVSVMIFILKPVMAIRNELFRLVYCDPINVGLLFFVHFCCGLHDLRLHACQLEIAENLTGNGILA
ncbi:hypothetical protein LWI29_016396 [Acer saccharum]|uniref:Uncharacterized protein n=1 Tax=Acer saccharum TaxID=4024 RepID=A0AA39SIM4_ACESA|nr:hypothetical protein LWI29_016396 [Acer saccharum]